MNIKEHIEAGHYERDDKGRALVPMRGGQCATILATDRPDFDGGREPIVGWIPPNATVATWWPHGEHSRQMPANIDLLPPPPRRVTLKLWHSFNPDPDHQPKETKAWNGGLWTEKPHYGVIEKWREAGILCIELTGEYEEPWPS